VPILGRRNPYFYEQDGWGVSGTGEHKQMFVSASHFVILAWGGQQLLYKMTSLTIHSFRKL